MLRNVFSALAGGLFGFGLLVSGMTDTTKVQGWLDIFGNWDPTLAFVLGGAILPMLIAWRVASRRARAVLGNDLPGKPSVVIDRGLVTGSLMFGAGWGLAGLCPGPAMASISWGGTGGIAFVLAMIAGMMLTPLIKSRMAGLIKTAG